MYKNLGIMGRQMLTTACVLALMIGIAVTGYIGINKISACLLEFVDWSDVDMVMNEDVIQKLLGVENNIAAYAKDQDEESHARYLESMEQVRNGVELWRETLSGKDELLLNADGIQEMLAGIDRSMTTYKTEVDNKDRLLLESDSIVTRIAGLLDEVMEQVIDPAKENAESRGDIPGMVRWGEIDMVMNEAVIASTLRLVTALHDYAGGMTTERFEQLAKRFAQASDGLKEWSVLLTGLPELERTAEQVAASLKEINGNIQELVNISRQETELLAAVHENVDQVMALTDFIMIERIDPSKQAAVSNAENTRLQAKMLLLAASLAAVIMGLVLSWLSALFISRNIKRAAKFANQIAGGDLDVRIESKIGAEIGDLMKSLSIMVDKLKEMFDTVEKKSAEAMEESKRAKQAVEQAREANARAEAATREGMLKAAASLEEIVGRIADSSEELSAQADEISQGMEIQSGRINETATAMEEMNSTVLEVARNAGEAAETAGKTREQAELGSQIVTQVDHSFESVVKRFETMKESLKELGEQADGIGEVMNVINDIADQTNLLALNAAIEAARAGDAGRGFAVVADEVRKLAEKTMSATHEVGDNIGAIQGSTRRAIQEMDDSVEAIGKTTELSNQSGAALREIVDYADTNSDRVRNIATASEEQSATSEQISRAVEEVNRITAETADSMRQSALAINELAGLAGELGKIVEELKR